MKSLFAWLLLTLLSTAAFSQKSSATKPGPRPLGLPATFRVGQPVILSWPQQVLAVHRVDSLQQLAARRQQQASAATRAAAGFRRACDSLRTANSYQYQQVASLKEARISDSKLLVSQIAKTDKYRARAHRKGWVIAVLSSAVAGLGYALAAR